MIRESFVLLPSVRYRTETKFWNQGLNSWDDFIASPKVKGLSTARKDNFTWRLQEAKKAFAQ